MKLWRFLPVLAASVALLGAGGPESPDKRLEARAERSLALGVNLLGWDGSVPEGGWSRWFPRPELAPGFSVDRQASSRGVPSLRLSGLGRQFVFGGWRRTITGIEPGKAYSFHAAIEAQGVMSIRRNIVCQIRWIGSDLGNEITPEYVGDFEKGQGYLVTLDQTFSAPANASGVEISLMVQWAPDANLLFRDVAFETAKPAQARIVRVATVYWRPSDRSTPEQNVAAFSALIDKVAAQRPDVVLLPEAITSIGAGLSVVDAAEEMPGPAFFALAAKAREHHCYIIYGAYEKEKSAIYNSAFIIGRDGTLAGAYRKVQLPYGEVESGLSPGDYYRTFTLDFGKVGILICHDTAFDEPARVEALDGAEILFVPIWGGDLTQLKTRAMDNGVWLVTSGYDVPSAVIDPTGEISAITWKEVGDGTAWFATDLAKVFRRPYIGDWHNAVFKQRRTDAYSKLLED